MASKLSQITRYWQEWQKVNCELWLHPTKILVDHCLLSHYLMESQQYVSLTFQNTVNT